MKYVSVLDGVLQIDIWTAFASEAFPCQLAGRSLELPSMLLDPSTMRFPPLLICLVLLAFLVKWQDVFWNVTVSKVFLAIPTSKITVLLQLQPKTQQIKRCGTRDVCNIRLFRQGVADRWEAWQVSARHRRVHIRNQIWFCQPTGLQYLTKRTLHVAPPFWPVSQYKQMPEEADYLFAVFFVWIWPMWLQVHQLNQKFMAPSQENSIVISNGGICPVDLQLLEHSLNGATASVPKFLLPAVSPLFYVILLRNLLAQPAPEIRPLFNQSNKVWQVVHNLMWRDLKPWSLKCNHIFNFKGGRWQHVFPIEMITPNSSDRGQ